MRIVNYRGKWCALVHIGGERFRRSLGLDATDVKERCPNYPAAQRAGSDLERALAQPKTDTVGEIVEAYLADTKAITKTYMEWMWGVLKPHCSGLRVDQVDRKWCREYAVKRGKANGTIRKEIGLLAAAIRWAGKTGAVIELPPMPDARDRWLTKAEFMLLLEAAQPHPHLVVFLHLAIATGARKEAVLDLRWPAKDSDHVQGAARFASVVDLDAGAIRLGRKQGGKARATVPITRTLRAVLVAAKARAETDHVVEFGGAKVGNIKKAFATAVKNAGLVDVTPHDLRHSAAVWMAGAGTDMEKIAQYLGHSDSRITKKVYARFQPDHLRDAADALELDIAPRPVS